MPPDLQAAAPHAKLCAILIRSWIMHERHFSGRYPSVQLLSDTVQPPTIWKNQRRTLSRTGESGFPHGEA
jgi:hypothetical protein